MALRQSVSYVNSAPTRKGDKVKSGDLHLSLFKISDCVSGNPRDADCIVGICALFAYVGKRIVQ